MKKLRKIISLILCCIMVISMGTVSASAFGGYAHWTIASVRMDLNDSQALSENIIEARNGSKQNYNLFTAQEMNELSQYYSIETTDISDGEAFISVSKNDVESYNRVLSRIVSEKMAVLEECEIY